jgi:uncharacterized protein (TIGR00296 family)
MAEPAATRDPRFAPLRSLELSSFSLEISAIGPMQEITTPSDIRVGTQDIWVKRNLKQGLLLPQVATRNQWGREDFLQSVCKKAGLSADAWRHPETHIFVFSAEVFQT